MWEVLFGGGSSCVIEGMKKSAIFLVFIASVVVGAFCGMFGHIERVTSHFFREKDDKTRGEFFTPCPVLKDQNIVAIVLAENVEDNVERNLSSLFDQTYTQMRIIYVDNGSKDRTYEKARTWVEKSGKVECVTLIKMEEHRPILEVFYELIGSCDSHEVIVPIDGKDWLLHEGVFDHLNCVYADPNVWMTHSRSISHPGYQKIYGHPISGRILKEKRLRKEMREELPPLVTFYAGVFHEIKLQDLMYEGSFVDQCGSLAMHLPLFEMGAKHTLFIDALLYVRNERDRGHAHTPHLQDIASVHSHLERLAPYSHLSMLRQSEQSIPFYRYKSDIIIFSEDTPLHLYACLESLFLNGSDINEVYVIYKGSNHGFQHAYLSVKDEFYTVQFFNVCDHPGKDFSSSLIHALSNRRHASPYVMIGGDHMIFDRRLCFHDCIWAMERTHADHFVLDAGDHIFPSSNRVSISTDIFACQSDRDEMKHVLMPALYRKTFFQALKGTCDFSTLMGFCQNCLSHWSVALVFNEEKVLSLWHEIEGVADYDPRQEWKDKFIEGFKIDLSSISHRMKGGEDGDHQLPLVRRERRQMALKEL